MKIQVVTRYTDMTARGMEENPQYEGENLSWNFIDGKVDIYDGDGLIATWTRELVIMVKKLED